MFFAHDSDRDVAVPCSALACVHVDSVVPFLAWVIVDAVVPL